MTKEEAKHFSEVLKAYSEGKTIQKGWYDSSREMTWKDIETFSIGALSEWELRIKPESKLRPYANAEEFLKDQKKHGPYFVFEDNYLIFPIRVMPSGLELYVPWNGDNTVRGICYSDILDFKWQDGYPCGILEE